MSAENFYFRSDYEYGTVVAQEGEWVTVELPTQDSCHSCGAKMICQPNRQGRRVLRLPNTIEAQIGDLVRIEQVGKKQLMLTAVQYGLPLATFLLLVIGGNYLIRDKVWGIPHDLFLMFIGLVGVGLSGVVIYYWSKWQARRRFSVFRLVSIVSKEGR